MTKSHSVNVSFEDEDYDTLKALADEQDRTINEQARHLLRGCLKTAKAVQKFRDAPRAEPSGGVPYGRGVAVVCDAGVPDEAQQKVAPADAAERKPAFEPHATKQEPLPG